MRLKFFTLFGCSLACIAAFVGLSSSNSGNSSTSCGGGGCHGNLSANTSINLLTVPSLSTGYTPNTTYACTLAVVNSTASQNAAGFCASNTGGTFQVPSGVTDMAASSAGSIIGHTNKRTATGGNTLWFFDWKAPATSTNNVIFTVAGNAVNSNGQPSGDQWAAQNFTFTPASVAVAPTVSGTAASNITSTGALISGIVNANGNSTNVEVQYGLTTALGNMIATIPSTANGSSNTNVQATLTGLTPGTLYHYRLVANNSGGNGNSGDLTFTTNSGVNINDFADGGFSLAPNPSNDGRYFVTNASSAPIEISVYDFTGKKVNTTISSTGNNKTYTIDLLQAATGNYILRLVQDGKIYGQLISKQ